MDIFTTALTRVVPVPIKPANVRVKAVSKDTAAHNASEDLDDLEYHQFHYIRQPVQKRHSQQNRSKQASPQNNVIEGDALDENSSQQVMTQQARQANDITNDEIIQPTPVPLDNTGQNIDLYDDSGETSNNASNSSHAFDKINKDKTKGDEDDTPHCDLFV